jgi:transposase-like protein
MYVMKFKTETIAIQDSKKTKFKSHHCCKTYTEFGENRLTNDTTVVKNAQFGPFLWFLRHAAPCHMTTGALNIVRV